MATGSCWGCRSLKEIFYTEEETGRQFCQVCLGQMPASSEDMYLTFLMLTIPFKIGDRVEGRTAAQIYDGIGVVEEVSISLEHGGTPVYPTFRVKIEDKAYPECPDEIWYTEVCLKHVGEKV